MASISKQSKEMQDRHRKLLANELKKPENAECMDCRARNPTWASTNLGIYVCIRCSGLHRQIGVHITKVKSCTMDLWDVEQISFMQGMGNSRGKEVYEARLPPDYGKPAESEDSTLVLQWIRTKYEKKKYWHTGNIDLVKAVPRSVEPPAAKVQPKKKHSVPAEATAASSTPHDNRPPTPSNYDEFMSPCALSPNLSPRGSVTSAFKFMSDQPATASAFNFVNASPGSPATVPAETGQPSAFSFLNGPASSTEGTANAHQGGESAFAFISGGGGEGATDGASWGTPTTMVETKPVTTKPPSLPLDSFMLFDSVPSVPGNPPPIPGHFSNPAVVVGTSGGVVFDPFETFSQPQPPPQQQKQSLLPVEFPYSSPPQLPVPNPSPLSQPQVLAPGTLPASPSAMEQQLLAMQLQLQQQFALLQQQMQRPAE